MDNNSDAVASIQRCAQMGALRCWHLPEGADLLTTERKKPPPSHRHGCLLPDEIAFLLPLDSEVYAGSRKVSPMSLFLLEVDPDTKVVRLKDVNHKYLAQVGQLAVEGEGSFSTHQ